MRITFGWYLDGVDWSGEWATLGAMACGPLGLLAWLEERLGLGMREVSQAERISEYKAKITAANCDWCRQSFALDPWACARQLLAWRDELVEAGWTGKGGESPRLEALWKIEQSGPNLSPGMADRLRMVLDSTRTVTAELTVVDNPQTYPALWRQLIDKFFHGYHCASLDTIKSLPEITVVEGSDNASLSVDLARYLSASQQDEKIALIAGGDTTFLDGILHRFGMPTIGRGSSSECRDALQILPLWLENMWEPFNAKTMMEMLLLKHSPIPHAVGKVVVRCLQEAPGLNAPDWLAKAKTALSDHGTYPAERIDDMLKFCEKVFTWERFDEEKGIPQELLGQRLGLLSQHLSARASNTPELRVTLSHIQILQNLVPTQPVWCRQDLARAVEMVVGAGTRAPLARREASPFTVVTHPGQLRDAFDTVIWWDFVDACQSASTYWSQKECQELSKEGCKLESNLHRQREAAAWNHAVKMATGKFLAFVPATQNGEAVPHHPFYDELAQRMGPDAFAQAKITSQQLRTPDGMWKLAGKTRKMQKSADLKPTPRGQFLNISSNGIAPQKISATQLETFLSCPFKWFLEKHLHLKDPAIVGLPEESQMTGTLAHKVVEQLFAEKRDWLPDEAADWAQHQFDKLLPKMATALLENSKHVERNRIRSVLANSIRELITLIAKHHWTVIGTELGKEISWMGIALEGRCDLVLKDDQGKEVVIDLKWSNSDYYLELVRHHKSVQLATYAKLLDPAKQTIPSGYYLLPRMLYIPNSQDDAEVWKRVEQTYQVRLKELQEGRLWYGVDPEIFKEKSEERQQILDEQHLGIDVIPCGFCSWKYLCGKMSDIHNEED